MARSVIVFDEAQCLPSHILNPLMDVFRELVSKTCPEVWEKLNVAVELKYGKAAVAALPRQGQTLQFQRRDADAATEDMAAMLARVKRELAGGELLGAVLCCCNGRGHRLFGEKSHDARMVQDRLGPLGLAGFFCNGEIGPVGEKNFLHGYTASLALFVRK